MKLEDLYKRPIDPNETFGDKIERWLFGRTIYKHELDKMSKAERDLYRRKTKRRAITVLAILIISFFAFFTWVGWAADTGFRLRSLF